MRKMMSLVLVALMVILAQVENIFAARIVSGNGIYMVDLGSFSKEQVEIAQRRAIDDAIKKCGGPTQMASDWQGSHWRGKGYLNGYLFISETAWFECLESN